MRLRPLLLSGLLVMGLAMQSNSCDKAKQPSGNEVPDGTTGKLEGQAIDNPCFEGQHSVSHKEPTPGEAIGPVRISGTVTTETGAGLPSVILVLAPGPVTATSDAAGNFSFRELNEGAYTLSPSLPGYDFEPLARSVKLSADPIEKLDFKAIAVEPSTIKIRVNRLTADWPDPMNTPEPSEPLPGVKVQLMLEDPASVISVQTTDSNGRCTFAGLKHGNYVVRVVPDGVKEIRMPVTQSHSFTVPNDKPEQVFLDDGGFTISGA